MQDGAAPAERQGVGDRGRAGGWALVALGAYALLLTLQPLPPAVGQPLSYVVLIVTAVAAARELLARAARGRPALRRARQLVAGSLLCGSLGGVTALVLHLVTGSAPAPPSPADAFSLSFLPLAVAGLLQHPVEEGAVGSRVRSLLDGALAAVALWLIVWTALLGPAGVGAGLSRPAALTALAYPAADVFLIAMTASVVLRVAPEVRGELSLMACGLGAYAAADLAYTVQTASGTYRSDSWVGALSETGLALVLLAARRPRVEEPSAPPRWLGALPFVPVVPATALVAVSALRGTPPSGTTLLLCALLTGCLLARLLVGDRDRSRALVAMRRREELFRSLVTGSSDFITLHSADGRLRYASPALPRVTGVPEDQLLGQQAAGLLHPDDRAAADAAMTRVLAADGARADLLCRVHVAGGGWRWCEVVLHNALADPSVAGIVCNTRDVHERTLLEQQVRYAALHDALTGLGNLVHARQLLDRLFAPAAPCGSVALVDLDGFKAVNDSYGHAQGDALLVAIAARLRRCLGPAGEVTRIGGDEFLLVLPDDDDGQAVADRVLDALRRPVVVAGQPLTTGASVGLATAGQASTPEELLRNADLAMYAAKAAGRGGSARYAPHLHEAAARRMQVQRGLRRALDEGHLSLHYQPIVDLPNGTLVGLEALLRWQEPDGDRVPPDVFVPIAEESGLMAEVDVWVLDTACAQVAAWRASSLHVPPVSVNISRRQVTGELPGIVAHTLARHRLPASSLCIEITESAVVRDLDLAVEVLEEVRQSGVRVVLDDFGTGESSLASLARLPVDRVKIDKAFVLSAEPGARRLLTSVVGVCRALELPVVAEGIEDPELVGHLASIGCQYGQGYHFGRPQPADQAALGMAVRVPRTRAPGGPVDRVPAA